ncbi:MAG: N-6 DNA methylase [Candidatus Competibacteraceae bacterium]
MKRSPAHSLGFDTLRLEGALLLPDLLEKAAQGQASCQQPADYHVPRGFTLQEEIGRAFRIAQAQWKAFSAGFERTDLDANASARAFVEEFLRDALGYADTRPTPPRRVGERRFPVTLQAAPNLPVVVAPAILELDDPDPAFAPQGGGARKKSPFQLLQEYLNAEPEARWGFASNGRRLRLARDAATLTRPSFIEFDLETMLGQARYPDFAALWRLLHASRATRQPDPVWETWRSDGQREGARVREGLRIGVEAALVTLGAGFLKHPANEPLRCALIAGDLKRQVYFEELLRLVYRFIFLFAVEERGLLHPADDSPAAAAARRIYEQGYSARRLRERCLRRVARDAYDDLWQAQLIVFRALATGEPRLALPALGGLFAPGQCPHLDAASLSNRVLLEAMRSLRWSQASGTVAPVDYRNMGPEALGSVYESLLELVPDPDPHARTFGFVNADADGDTKGNARKTTGSYYTPDSLVQELIRSALDPVIDARLAAKPDRPTEALLGITVVDPACGSGHFLLAAARRLAERLAALRAPEDAVRAQDYRHALREVITHCIYGVDRNPMALELARFALWLEGFEEGRPLGFLDHHLVCGDTLLGITDVGQLAHGIPDAAFKPLSGDDKAVCKALAKENKEGLKAFAKRKADANLPLALERDNLLAERAALESMPDDTLVQQAAKQAAWERYAAQERASRLQQAADLFVGAFLSPKAVPEDIEHTPTSQNLYLALFTDKSAQELAQVKQAERLAHATQCACDARVLHWPLAFVQVFQKGGFDCVLGNPPWERIKLQEEEFFAAENRFVAQARNKAERAQRIEWLAQGMLVRHLYPELEHAPDEAAKERETYARFIAARRMAEAASVFAHLKAEEGGRYPLTGVGDVNTYALFAETIDQVIGRRGRAGFIVPSGIATDDSTKRFFSHLVEGRRLVSLFGFDNARRVFPAVHPDTPFSLVTLGEGEAQVQLAHYILGIEELNDERRRFSLGAGDFELINPNTRTCPVFRSRKDAELTKKIYARVPMLIREARDGEPEVNPWGISFMRMFDMSNDSHLFADQPAADRLPLYEAKMIHQYDHRWATYRGDGSADVSVDVPLADKRDPAYAVRPRYWVEAREVYLRTAALPKGLLTALRERNRPVILRAVAHLLFAGWLSKRHRTADEAMQHLYTEWCAFVEAQPFARHLAPTQLRLCADNPPCLKSLGPHYLPAEAIDAVKAGPRESTAWYEADIGAVAALLDVPSAFPVVPEAVPMLDGEDAALAFAEGLLEAASPKWLVGFRDITNATNERTVIASVLPKAGVGNKIPLLSLYESTTAQQRAALIGNLAALCFDYAARQKVGGTTLNFFIAKQLPVLPSESYSESDLAFIIPRVLELTYTAHDLKPWAEALGYNGPPFPFDPDRRARLRAELDAYYARLYGLTREDLCYILDPASVMGEDYPSETFRVLKQNEEREFGEYRTQRLVLEAWDRLYAEIPSTPEYGAIA